MLICCFASKEVPTSLLFRCLKTSETFIRIQNFCFEKHSPRFPKFAQIISSYYVDVFKSGVQGGKIFEFSTKYWAKPQDEYACWFAMGRLNLYCRFLLWWHNRQDFHRHFIVPCKRLCGTEWIPSQDLFNINTTVKAPVGNHTLYALLAWPFFKQNATATHARALKLDGQCGIAAFESVASFKHVLYFIDFLL